MPTIGRDALYTRDGVTATVAAAATAARRAGVADLAAAVSVDAGAVATAVPAALAASWGALLPGRGEDVLSAAAMAEAVADERISGGLGKAGSRSASSAN